MTDRDHHAELLELPNELRGAVLSYYGGDMEVAGTVRRLRSMAKEIESHADAIEARDEQEAEARVTRFAWERTRI